MKSVRPKGRLPAALALSVALHAGLVAWLAARPPAPRAEQERIELRLVEVEAKEAEPPVATARPAPKPRATARGTATTTTTPTPTATSTSTSNPTPTAAATAPGGATPLPGSPEWLASHGLEPAEAKGVSLALPWRGGGSVAEGTASTTERLPGEPAEVAAKRNVDGWLRDLAALERARHPDGYWSGVRKRLEGEFSPGWEVLTGTRQDQGLLSRGQLRALAEAWKGYQEQAARYGATGSLYGAEPDAPGSGPELGRRDARPPPSLLGDVLHQLFHRELVALIRIRQEPDGKVASVELLRTSGNTDYDRLALERAEALRAEEAPALGPTPPQGRETLWAFATSFDMVPPVPVVGFSFDAWFVPTDVTYPLKKSARSEVELKAVY